MLPEDVLLEIFQYLDSVKDLANCELVCSGWRKAIVPGNPWKKLYLKKICSIPIWKKMSERLNYPEKTEKNKSKELCKDIITSLDRLKSNWSSAKFESIGYKIDSPRRLYLETFNMGENWLLMRFDDRRPNFLVLNRKTMKAAPRLGFEGSNFRLIKSYQNLILVGYENSIDVYDANTATKVTQMILENELRYLEVGGPGILVAGCLHQPHAVMLQEYRRVHTLTIWSIDSSQQITYRCQLDFTGEGLGVCVDLYYISVLLRQQEEDSYTIHFISTTTLNMERSLSTRRYLPSYSLNGILALTNEIDCIRFIDMPTGKHLQSIHVDIAEFEHDGTIVKTCVIRNTNFIVVITSNFEDESTMNIYDLEAMRNQQSTPQEILCASVTLGFFVANAEMDEFQILCSGKSKPDHKDAIFVLDFFK